MEFELHIIHYYYTHCTQKLAKTISNLLQRNFGHHIGATHTHTQTRRRQTQDLDTVVSSAEIKCACRGGVPPV